MKNNLRKALNSMEFTLFDIKEITLVKKRHDNWWMGLLG